MTSMKTRPFKQVDVFTATPYFGNPLAVVLDGDGLDDTAMQRFAAWTHLSETTFLLPPTDPAADYRVRIFTPGGELPFAGHPTLGSCHAWLQAGGRPKTDSVVVQQCAQGLVPIRRAGQRLAFAAPVLRRNVPSPTLVAQIAAALGITAQQIVAAQLLDNGPSWLGLLLNGADTVLALAPDHRALAETGQKVGVAGLYPPGSRTGGDEKSAPSIEVRAFVAPIGVDEDPVTGSLNASLAQWLIDEGHLPERYVAGQGQALGRDGRVHITRDSDRQVWVGGDTVTCIEGWVTL
jgi:PhzF family phenazine biosynthesis protein